MSGLCAGRLHGARDSEGVKGSETGPEREGEGSVGRTGTLLAGLCGPPMWWEASSGARRDRASVRRNFIAHMMRGESAITHELERRTAGSTCRFGVIRRREILLIFQQEIHVDDGLLVECSCGPFRACRRRGRPADWPPWPQTSADALQTFSAVVKDRRTLNARYRRRT